MIQRVIVSLVMLFGILMLLLPKTDDASVAMMASGAMLKCSMDYRSLVARQVINREAVTVEFRNPCPDMIAAIEVTKQGEMVITGSKHSLVLTLTPVVENGSVLWSCIGEPAAVVTKLCKTIPIKAPEEPVLLEEDVLSEEAIVTPQDE